MNALDSVDYADHHACFEHDAKVDVPADLSPWLADRVAVAHEVLHKPLVIGEVGFSRAAVDPADRGAGTLGLTITLDGVELCRIDSPRQRVRVAGTTPPGRALLARYEVDPPGTELLMLRLR